MRKIEKPKFDAGDIMLECSSNIRDLKVKQSFIDFVKDFRLISESYDKNGENGTLYLVSKISNSIGLTDVDHIKLYTDKLSKIGQPGRQVYESILDSAPLGICPYCLQKIVSTIDHVLPKKSYSKLSIVPYNLVPSCWDCNVIKGQKGKYEPKVAENVHIHPYYDEVESEQWLHAEFKEEDPILFKFEIICPKSMDAVLAKRLEFHFNFFELGTLYSIHSASQLENLSYLTTLYSTGGGAAVKEHLDVMVNSVHERNINSWMHAMNRALSKSIWFCNEGVKSLGRR